MSHEPSINLRVSEKSSFCARCVARVLLLSCLSIMYCTAHAFPERQSSPQPWQVARIFLGIGEAFNAPACYALITLYFPNSRKATANGIYSTGTYLGSALSSLCISIATILGEHVAKQSRSINPIPCVTVVDVWPLHAR